MKRKYLYKFEWIYYYNIIFHDDEDEKISYTFSEIYNCYDEISLIHDIVFGLNFPYWGEIDKIKKMMTVLEMKIPIYFNKNPYMFNYFIASIRSLYFMNIYNENSKSLEKSFNDLEEKEQNYINKLVNIWKLRRSEKYMKKYSKIFLFYEYLNQLRENKRNDLIEDIKNLVLDSKEEMIEYIKEQGNSNIISFLFEKYFVYYFNDTFVYSKKISFDNNIDNLLFDGFFSFNEIDFYFLNYYIGMVLKESRINGIFDTCFEIPKRNFLKLFNDALFIMSNYTKSKFQQVTTTSRVWINFLENCETNHVNIEKKYRTLIIQHKILLD